MAYAVKYIVPFSSLILKISKKDFVGDTTTIVAAQPAVLHKWDEDDPIAPIKGSSLTANIIGVPLIDFYANNDDEYKGELFKDDGSLLFSGFLVQDDCTEDVDDLDHVVSLSFTDNLGLLKEVPFEGGMFLPSKITLTAIINLCLYKTGSELPINVYSKLKEDQQSTTTSFLAQTLIAKETFLKSDDEYDNCYSVLETILKDLGATLIQANGQWNIIRFLERPVTGFGYDADFNPLSSNISYPDAIYFGFNMDLYPEYGYHKKIERPYVSVKKTFRYEQPFTLIKNADLKDVGPLISTSTNGDLIYEDYELKGFVNQNGNNAFIRVVKDNVLFREKERYIVQPQGLNTYNVTFKTQPIEVNKFDRFNLTYGYSATVDDNLEDTNGVIVTVTSGSTVYYLNYIGNDNSGTYVWNTVDNTSYPRITRTSFYDLTQNGYFDLGAAFGEKSIQIPADGFMEIAYAMDFNHSYLISGFTFNYYTFINKSTQVSGQTHTNTQFINIKNKSDENISIDDSPKNNIKGTLFLPGFTNGLQNRTTSWTTPSLFPTPPVVKSCKLYTFSLFGPDDSHYAIKGISCDGTEINIIGTVLDGAPASLCARPGTISVTGNIVITDQSADCGTYTDNIPRLQLGRIVTTEKKQWRSEPRTVTEGTLYGDVFVSPLNTFRNPAFPEVHFVPGNMEIDYGNNSCTGTMYELYKTVEAPVVSEYKFEYIYDTK